MVRTSSRLPPAAVTSPAAVARTVASTVAPSANDVQGSSRSRSTRVFANKVHLRGRRAAMRTRATIMGIVLAAVSAAAGVVVLLGVLFGWPGLAGVVAALAGYRLVVQPWQHRWGASDEEVGRAMPGDEVVPDAASTTRASSSGWGWATRS